ncbi:hypothetical protein [Mesorhizobium sangaii]|uniref:Uncharacterized protein n=1 Tax=Mesorhizobium sangaii TaxID=505389 RepID=A0A841PD87_9HYPH|nr:hypothetical protein [Mesorhizobium sangaii]MBB6411701.1 hypothetical protein [Mesorhizobium sangaii]
MEKASKSGLCHPKPSTSIRLHCLPKRVNGRRGATVRAMNLWQAGNSFAGAGDLLSDTQGRAPLSHDPLNGLFGKLAKAVLLDLGGKNRQQNSIGGAPMPRSWSWTSLLRHKVHVARLVLRGIG